MLLDQTSILRFIGDNWLDGERISDTSFDNIAGSIEDMFDFDQPNPRRLFLDPSTGEITKNAGQPDRQPRRPRHPRS